MIITAKNELRKKRDKQKKGINFFDKNVAFDSLTLDSVVALFGVFVCLCAHWHFLTTIQYSGVLQQLHQPVENKEFLA